MKMKKQILKYSLIFLTLGTFFFAWKSVHVVINNSGSADWIIPAGWFLFALVLASLDAILIKRFYILAILFFVSFSLSFVFVWNGWHAPTLLLGALFFYLGAIRVRRDLKMNLRIDLWKSLRFGRIFFVLAVSMLITSQYYFEIKNRDPAEFVLELDFSGGVFDTAVSRIIPLVVPGLEIDDGEDITVDEFIIGTQRSTANSARGATDEEMEKMIVDQFGSDLSPTEKEALKNQAIRKMDSAMAGSEELILKEGRRQFSEIVGMELSGDEKVSEVFSDMLNNKVNEFFGSEKYDSDQLSFLPAAFAAILFLSVFSLGSFFSPVWMMLSWLVFFVLNRLKVIEVKKVPAEMEVIE